MQKILIIDDELFFREVVTENLKTAGYSSIAASSGQEGLDILKREKGSVSMILLDIIMPDMDGLATLERIKELDPDIPVIMMTAHTDEELVLRALKNGAFDYLAKPLYTEELLLSTKRAFDHYRLVMQNDTKLKQLKNLEIGAQRLLELAKGSIRMEAVMGNNKLLQATIDLIASVLEAEKVSMMLVDEEKKELRVVVANGLNLDLSTLPVRKVGEGIAGTVAERGEAVLVKDIKADAVGAYGHTPLQESGFAGQYKTGSFLCVPVKVLGKTIGVISVNDKLSGESFTDSDLTIMTTFSHQVSLALENAMINADMERYIEKLTLLNEISKTLLSMVDPKEIFKDIVKRTREALEVEFCTLLLSEETTGYLRFETGFGDKGELTQELTIKEGEGITGSVLQTGKMAVIDSAGDDKKYIPEIDGVPDLKIKDLLCAPLKIRDKTLGVIRAANKKGKLGFTARDIEIMEYIASQSSIALKNAWLYKNLVSSVDEVAATNSELERVNTQLKLKIKELELLKEGNR
ncbi:MAG: GAF domain-containing protein [Deltaproteobacteria bacterium]